MPRTIDPLWPSAFRDFGRVFTRAAGLLREAHYDPSLSLIESRILFELGQTSARRPKDLAKALSIDKGYLSRALGSLGGRGLLRDRRPRSDRRERWLALTPRGRGLLARIDRVSQARSREVLVSLGRLRSAGLIRALREASLHLSSARLQAAEIALRQPAPGDLGWVVARHGEIYHEEFGWNEEFEALVAQIVGSFAHGHDPSAERAWIAHARGARLGCVFLVRKDQDTAQLRILLVEPSARGCGVGSLLVRECLRFAKAAGYRRVALWTNSVLVSARRIYEAAGFALDREQRHRSFGRELVGQYWSKQL